MHKGLPLIAGYILRTLENENKQLELGNTGNLERIRTAEWWLSLVHKKVKYVIAASVSSTHSRFQHVQRRRGKGAAAGGGGGGGGGGLGLTFED